MTGPELCRPWDPGGPPAAYRTWSITVPRDRTVVAACEQVGCEAWLHGWRSTFDERVWCGVQGGMRSCGSTPPCGRHAADYVRRQSGRTFTERAGPEGLTEFLFDSRQRCFAEHRTRPEIYVARGGDWRAVTSEPRRYAGPADWVDDFGDHQQRLHDAHERG